VTLFVCLKLIAKEWANEKERQSMTKKKQWQTGAELLAEILREDAERGEPGYQVMTNEKSLTLRATEGHTILNYQYGNEPATVAVLFDT
jgi:hypothetical protein